MTVVIELFYQDYQFGDGSKALVGATKESLEKLGKNLGLIPDFEKDAFDVPSGCRRFILRPDLGIHREVLSCYLLFFASLFGCRRGRALER